MEALSIKPSSLHSDSDESIEQFVLEVPSVSPKVLGEEIKKMFEDDTSLEGIVVIADESPVGIIMRTAFFQKISTIHGHSLFMKRTIDLIMDTEMMTIETTESISQIGIRAMNREQNKLYDYILVNKDARYIGVISIRLFLIDLANRNSAQINVLKEQQRKLIAANEKEMMLSRDLSEKSASIRNLLDNADQGFLFFEKDLIIKGEYSYKCVEIFGSGIGEKNFLDIICEYFQDDKISVFNAAFDSYFKNNSAVTDNVYLMLLPNSCMIGDKHINISYRRIENNKNKAIMAIMSDVTEKIMMEQALENDRQQQRLIIKAVTYRSQIKQMIDEFYELFETGYNSYFEDENNIGENLNVFFREVHTFKGDFAQYGFINASNELHIVEDRLSKLVHRKDEVHMIEIENIVKDVNPKSILKKDLKIIKNTLGESYFGGSETLNIPRYKLDEAAEKIMNAGAEVSTDTALDIINSLNKKPLKDYLEQYRDYVQYLSDKLMKTMPVYIVEGDEVEIHPDIYREFFKSLVHIYRNIMDHGIESDEERLEAGKPQTGTIKCLTESQGNSFSITISDDGNGINIEKLCSAAVSKGIYNSEGIEKLSEKEKIDIIFYDNMSTKSAASTLSGRGVGMAAFKSAAERIGGNVTVKTESGKGTEFTVSFPL